jgi:hypothetical protein
VSVPSKPKLIPVRSPAASRILREPSSARRKVTLINEGTGTSPVDDDRSRRVYVFSPVRIGSYKLEVSAPSFKTEVQRHIVSRREREGPVDNFKLTPGAVSETIEVTSAAPVLQAEDASVGQVVDAAQRK